MNFSSKLIQDAVEQFSRLPGIGRKSALRLTLHLLKMEKGEVRDFGEAFISLRENINYCNDCHNISDLELCEICVNPNRDNQTICVVEDIRDVMAIENTHQFKGKYHVLGGLICGAVAVIYYAKKYGIHYKIISDAAAPGLMLAYGIGRMGCHFSGDGDWGINNLAPKPEWMSFLPDWTWAYTYPNNVINAGVPIEGCIGNYCNELMYPVYPTPLYEIVIALGLFAFLWSIRKRISVPGVLFGIYMIVNGLERFFIEKIRINTNYIIFGKEITQAEIISFALIITGLIIVFRLLKGQRKVLT
ncbi:prolipoprotein diacylglyceryl transferase [bacterium]|nr:prolipoprotein diacylglyceryl transferase [bacterium]